MTVRLTRVNGALHWYSEPDSWAFDLSCPRCGGGVEHVSDGRSYAWHVVAAVRCSECRWSGAVTVELATVAENVRGVPQRANGCGTDAGYQAHRRRDEEPCDPCLAAHAKLKLRVSV